MTHLSTECKTRSEAAAKRRSILSRLLKFRRRALGSEEGATLVEFAFASTVMLTLLFGLLETCLAVYSYDFVAEAARDGARYMIVRGTKCTAMPDCQAINSTLQSHLRSMNYPAINMNSLTTTTAWYTAGTAPPNMTWTLCSAGTPSSCAIEGNAVKVTVNYPFTFNVPFLKPMVINMSNSSMMVISQ
jgi:Flp pilus assembly protein TadG